LVILPPALRSPIPKALNQAIDRGWQEHQIDNARYVERWARTGFNITSIVGLPGMKIELYVEIVSSRASSL